MTGQRLEGIQVSYVVGPEYHSIFQSKIESSLLKSTNLSRVSRERKR